MSSVHQILEFAPPGTEAVLQAFAQAESLTDLVAEKIYRLVPLEGIPFAQFMRALRFSNVVQPRNSEWNIRPDARARLRTAACLNDGQRRAVHRLLLDEGKSDKGRPGLDIPHYLLTDAGIAYHQAALGETARALHHYAEAAMSGRFSGAQWLAAELAAEQERENILPSGAIETLFLRAMVLFRTGRRKEALPLLHRIAASDEVRREVGIALHLVGDDQARRRDPGAERSYKRSIAINEALHNWRTLSHVLHSAANLYAREHRYDEAEAAYRRSIELRGHREVNDWRGLAQTETSLGNMYARQGRFPEAEEAFARGIDIDIALHNRFGVAKAENSLANLYVREKRYADAEAAFERSIKIGVAINERGHVALTEHSLANLYADLGRYDQANDLLVKSNKTLKELGDEYGVAVTDLSLANLYARQGRFDEAEEIYLRRIEIGEKLPYKDHLARVLLSYGKMIETRSPRTALDLFQRSLEIDLAAGNRRGVRIVHDSLNNLYRRNPGLRRR